MAELAAWVATSEPVIGALVREVAAVRAKERAADLAAHLLVIAGSGELATPYKPLADGASISAGSRIERDSVPTLESVTAQIESVVARLDPEASAAEREQVNSAARSVLMDSTLSSDTMLTQLKVLVQRVGKSSAKRRDDRELALGLVRVLDGIIGAEADDLRQLLERVASGSTPLAGVDAARVSDVRARAIAEEDRLLVAELVATAFSKEGYDLGPEFSRDLASGDPAYAFVSDSPDHAVEVQLGAGKYSYRLVHSNQNADSSRDADLELLACKAIGRATAEGHDGGAQFTIDEHRPPGSAPVPFAAKARERRRGRTAADDRLRERKR